MKRAQKFPGKIKSSAPLDPDEILADSSSALSSPHNLEGKLEKPVEKFYCLILLLLMAGGLIYLGSRAALLQVKSGKGFFVKSQENRFLERIVFPPRGIIYDRFDKPLVENIPILGLVFEKDEFLKSGKNLADLLDQLGQFLQKPRGFFLEVGFPENLDYRNLPARIFITNSLTVGETVSIASHLDSLQGIKIFEGYRRFYKNAVASSHLVGFVGKVSQEDISRNQELNKREVVGKTGIEAFYDERLSGKLGKKILEVDSMGRETRFKLTEQSEEGLRLRLTVDSELQDVIYETLQNYTGGKKGASVVVIDPRNGEIRALVSSPAFDSNKFGYSLSRKEFEQIQKNPLAPLFNRAISGETPSGSTIKPLIAAAALEEKLIDPNRKIYDEGFIEIPNPYKPGEKSVFVDWRKHGWVDFYDAIAWSANVYFYMIGGGYKEQKGLGIEKIKKYVTAFGLGDKLGIDLQGEKGGLIPDPQIKRLLEPKDPIWRIGDTYNVSIGQGGVKVTPLQMAAVTSVVANGGTLYQPHLLNVFLDNEGKVVQKFDPKIIRENIVSKENLSEVAKGMRRTVTVGTARLLQGVPVAVAAKTGTAQTGSGIPHAWVTAFAPLDNPIIAVAVMIEHAGEGATVAVPIMHDILWWYFSNRSELQ